jgi:hypothetical protein
MSFGERAALEGVLAIVKPALAIEIGTAEGGSLRRVAAHSEVVHSFDLVPPPDDVVGLENVSFHTGDSHELLPRFLSELEQRGESADFVLVDGDHSAEGVKRDLEDLLASSAIRRTAIVIHDTANGIVRGGVDAVSYESFPSVSYVELDFVAGYMFREPTLRHELWGGLGLVVVDDQHPGEGREIRQSRYYEAAPLLRDARGVVLSREHADAMPESLKRRLAARALKWLTSE